MSGNLRFQKKLRQLIEEEMLEREKSKHDQVQSVYIELAAYKAAEDVVQDVIVSLNKHYGPL
ncbi:hypothetical protein VpaJT1_38 [Vibrio phage VpaJT_1]|nr:hypothetical protein VpaJT1_38 [Vibrio phage VpaJT_1]